MNDNGEVKVADFGLARICNMSKAKYTREVVTLWYRCPEILMGDEYYTSAVDIWSIGCIMFELTHKKVLFSGDSEIGQLMKIFEMLGTPTDETWPGFTELKFYKPNFPKFKGIGLDEHCTKFSGTAVDLLSQLVDPCPFRRIQATEAVKHPWFDDLDKSKYASPDFD